MSSAMKSVPFFVLCALIISVPSLWASWMQDGVAICTATDWQEGPEIASDGMGGAIIAWMDYRGAATDIYAQRVDASGTARWTGDGVALCTATGSQMHLQIIPDGAGGAFAVWQDSRGADLDIYAQRVNASGLVQWGSDGVALCSITGAANTGALVSDGAGGAIVAWYDYRSGGIDIYAQRVNTSGDVLWATDGVALCAAVGSQVDLDIISDGAGGAIVAWADERIGGNYNIFAQRVNASGIVQWGSDGVAICTTAGTQDECQVVSDGADGAIIAWRDGRSGEYNIYAQRVNASGGILWTINGVALCAAAGEQLHPDIVSDAAGGAIVVWEDVRGASSDIYAQRVSALGVVRYITNGVPLCSAASVQSDCSIIEDGVGGAIVAWADYRGGNYDIYAQRVNALGVVRWTVDGIALCAQTSSQQTCDIVADGAGGAIAAWEDWRSSTSDIYAQQIDSQGRIGYLPPAIHSITDVPGDEGGFVNLAWKAVPFDYLSGEITRYTTWRALDTPSALALIEGDAIVLSSPAAATETKGSSILRRAALNGETFYWKLISSLDAYRLRGYSEIVPTLFDSTAVCGKYHYFQVIAHTADPSVYWISDPDSGYSVDNLAPAPPLSLMGEQNFFPAGLALSWAPNAEPDIGHYAVYRGVTEGFVPGPENHIASPADTLCFDGDWRWSDGYYYKVSAIDIHGNESGFALLRPEDVTGTETPNAPEATYLAQNFPNPFNPVTKIVFGLDRPASISLRVYDVAGRLVRSIAEGERAAAHYSEAWDGRDASGRTVASGLYFYRLDAGTFTQTRKMILLR